MLVSFMTPYGDTANVASAPMMRGRPPIHTCNFSTGCDIMCLAIHHINAMDDTDSHALITRDELGPFSSLNALPSHDQTLSIIPSLLCWVDSDVCKTGTYTVSTQPYVTAFQNN